MSAFFAIVKKEVRSILRERTIVIAIVIQLFIASFSSALLIGLLSFYDPDSISANLPTNLRVGVLGNTTSQLTLYLRERRLRVTLFDNATNAENAFRNRNVDVLLFVPPDDGNAMEMKMFLPPSETLSSFITILLKEPLKRYENYLRQQRGIAIRYTDVPSLPATTFEFLYSVILPMLMFFPAFVAGSIVIDSLSEEMETHTLETLWSAPLSLNTIFGAKIFAAFLVALVQCVVWLMLLRLNRIDIQNSLLVLTLAGLVAATNIVISAFTATWFKDRERSQFVYSLFILVVASLSYFLDAAPIQLLTRLAIGDYYTGIVDVAKYATLLLVLLIFFFRATKRFSAI